MRALLITLAFVAPLALTVPANPSRRRPRTTSPAWRRRSPATLDFARRTGLQHGAHRGAQSLVSASSPTTARQPSVGRVPRRWQRRVRPRAATGAVARIAAAPACVTGSWVRDSQIHKVVRDSVHRTVRGRRNVIEGADGDLPHGVVGRRRLSSHVTRAQPQLPPMDEIAAASAVSRTRARRSSCIPACRTRTASARPRDAAHAVRFRVQQFSQQPNALSISMPARLAH